MNQQIERSLETKKQSTFQQRIDAITGRQLRPEIIDSYADDALDDLVSVVDDVVTSYHEHPTYTYDNSLETELAAFAYHGIEPMEIEATLDHIAKLAEDIHGLDAIITSIRQQAETVIVQPDSKAIEINGGDGSFEKKQLIPRLKTVLFVLSEGFAIDLYDREQVRVTTGILTRDMMRGESYNRVEVPALHRTILVCDEEGNATFVLDNELLRAAGIEPEDLDRLSKNDLKDLLDTEPMLGQKIRYSSNYVENLTAALGKSDASGSDKYLQNVDLVPEGFVSLAHLAKSLGLSAESVQKVVSELESELGEIKSYKFKTGAPTKAYSPEQQELIRAEFAARGSLERLPDDYQTLYGLSKEFNLERPTISKAIAQLADQLGEVKVGRRQGMGTAPSPHYSPSQKTMIFDYLMANDAFVGPAPEGYMTAFGIAKLYGTDNPGVERAIAMLGESLGQVIKAKAKTVVSNHYSPAQQEMIRHALEAKGHFAGPPPAGYMSVPEMRDYFGGISEGVVPRSIEALGEELGEGVLARRTKRHHPQEYYSPQQIARIHAWIATNGRKRKNRKFNAELQFDE